MGKALHWSHYLLREHECERRGSLQAWTWKLSSGQIKGQGSSATRCSSLWMHWSSDSPPGVGCGWYQLLKWLPPEHRPDSHPAWPSGARAPLTSLATSSPALAWPCPLACCLPPLHTPSSLRPKVGVCNANLLHCSATQALAESCSFFPLFHVEPLTSGQNPPYQLPDRERKGRATPEPVLTWE